MRIGDIHKLAMFIIDKLENEGYLDNCTTCMFWNEKKEICDKFKERPPTNIIIHGCEYHETIPF